MVWLSFQRVDQRGFPERSLFSAEKPDREISGRAQNSFIDASGLLDRLLQNTFESLDRLFSLDGGDVNCSLC